VPSPAVLSPAELAAITDPAALLERAWSLEPALRLSERIQALDRLHELLERGPAPADAPGRSWQLELLAEWAINAAANTHLEQATELADRVLEQADPAHQIAITRALMARGRVLAWTGTAGATVRADRIFAEVAERCRALEHREWLGFTLFWRGNTIYYRQGDLSRGAELMREALDVLGPDSPRRSTVLDFYGEVLTDLGEWEAAEAILAEALELADRDHDAKSRAYAMWSQARVASARGDAFVTERLLREVERDAGDWFETHIGVAFLTDAVELLDRVGLTVEADAYLRRAAERMPDDENVRQARATMLARSGDPWEALEALEELARGDWLEKRLIWRHTLLMAWATFRAGRDDAGELAARALAQARVSGGVRVAQAGESELTAALTPLAELAGSELARALVLDGRTLLIRLFGTPSVTRHDGTRVPLPAGKPGELVRMLALHEHGLPVDAVLEAFFEDAPPAAARQRLRQVLTRLRSAAGEIVVRDGDTLRLAPAWVDVQAFLTAADRVRTTRGIRSVRRAYAALALHGGPLLPGDRYASWAKEIRDQVEYRHLSLLDLVAADATARGSHQEALTALDAAVGEDPDDVSRYSAIADQLLALGRHGTAQYLARLAGIDLDVHPFGGTPGNPGRAEPAPSPEPAGG
jgi:DNA-binding SARP family transcriptional activator/tetratricopeptide (TPR) repeat protein